MLKKFLCGVILVNLLALPSRAFQAEELCFTAKEKGDIVVQNGDCSSRYSPFSTFKIPLALMGFDSGVLTDSDNPSLELTEDRKKDVSPWHFPEKYPVQRATEENQTPRTWMRLSVIWYSQYITQQLGTRKLEAYLKDLAYGNQDISGTLGKNDGLKGSWLGSSLQISPHEQLAFIEKLAHKTLPVSLAAQEKTHEIIKMEVILDGWQLYGKTGGSKEFGWFVGWIEKGERKICCVQCMKQSSDSLLSGGIMAKELAKNNLTRLLFEKAKL